MLEQKEQIEETEQIEGIEEIEEIEQNRIKRHKRHKVIPIEYQLREIITTIEQKEEELSEPGTNGVKEILTEEERLSSQAMKFSQKRLGSECIEKLSHIVSLKSQKIQLDQKFSTKNFISRIKEKFSQNMKKGKKTKKQKEEKESKEGNISFFEVGKVCSEKYYTFKPNTIDLMSENISTEITVKERVKKEPEKFYKKEELDSLDNLQETQTVSRKIKMQQHLEAKYKKHEKLNFFETLFDSKKFSTTIDNFFDLSFLVRDGTSQIKLKKKEPNILFEKVDGHQLQTRKSNQFVYSFDYQTWKRMQKDFQKKK
ncbi:non-structural maintenance of chromosomes element 4 [Anaeramoeba ignava]|uniref:Non-structural maintenance of chromosomes element 4 n=1 Tax=Anaeramoeba ignava TaxID=1746090 RepID=A0A9Q0LAG7_ANAIG|nr:non-structural maintenance of chromosomes element 4 [Anaeramoeba ignava]